MIQSQLSQAEKEVMLEAIRNKTIDYQESKIKNCKEEKQNGKPNRNKELL